MTRIIAGLMAASIGIATFAQDQAPPLPPEGKRWVEAWVGTFRATDGRFTQGDKEFKFTMTMTCTRVAGGRGAACKARYETKGMPPGEDAYLMGWNVGAGQAQMFEVSSEGYVHDHAGTWSDDKSITLPARGKNLAGQDEEDVVTFTRLSPTRTQMKAEGKSGGKTLWSMEGTLVAQRAKK